MANFTHGRSGHAPGFLRDAFIDWVETGCDPDELVLVGDEEKELRWLIGRLWNCTDIMPRLACGDLDIPTGSTYAQAVRQLHDELLA